MIGITTIQEGAVLENSWFRFPIFIPGQILPVRKKAPYQKTLVLNFKQTEYF